MDFIKIPVKTFYMRMTQMPELYLKKDDSASFELKRLINPDIDYYREIFKKIGSNWGWTGRLLLSNDELAEVLSNDKIETYLLHKDSKLTGLFELDCRENGKIELVYFGLIPEMIGKGAGKYMMIEATRIAWSYKPVIFWLHTCEFDSPVALEFYRKAGFEVYDQKIQEEYYPSDFINSAGLGAAFALGNVK
jgi:GNAT superfamily N-acetyltransferase